jgi:glycosyltransferase involved in cell wall biosynthesis
VDDPQAHGMRALFVYNPNDLNGDPPGGVQRCTRELLDLLGAACPTLQKCEVDLDRSISARAKRVSGVFPYSYYNPAVHEESISSAIQKYKLNTVFLNTAQLMSLVPCVARIDPSVIVVLLSHGNESGDELYEFASADYSGIRGLASLLRNSIRLGGNLLVESQGRRRHKALVCVLSREEEVIERWLGAKETLFLPRIINREPLDWAPVINRVGYVGTLDHIPNRVALESILTSLNRRKHELVVEIVGAPPHIGMTLQAQFSFVRYLGVLNDEDLRDAARQWCAFLNPIFWLSRGSSMKLAQALSWGVPCVTTRCGRRGYELPCDAVIETSDDVNEFVARVLESAKNCELLKAVKKNMEVAVQTLPSNLSVAELLRNKVSQLRNRLAERQDV